MSRNSSRLAGMEDSTPEPADAPPINLTPKTELSFAVPTEFIEIPSQGKFYPEGHPLHGESVVEIRHMTAKDEDVLSSKALLKQGVVLDRFLKGVLVNRSINIDSLLLGDKNALLIGARISGFGSAYDTKVICPVCFAHGRHIFDLDNVKVCHGNPDELEGVDRLPNGNIIVNTPKTGVEIECRLFTGVQEKQLTAQQKRAEKQKLPDKTTTKQLEMAIVSVNGDADRSMIGRLIQSMPIRDSRYIRKAIEVCSPSVEVRDYFDCHECGASTDMEVPFTTDFFWPRQ